LSTARAPEWVRVARIVKPHGIRGELCLEMLGGGPERLGPGSQVRCGRGVLQVEEVRLADQRVLCRLSGIVDRDGAAAVQGEYLEVGPQSLRSLPDGEYFHFQLVGLRILDEFGAQRGELTEVETYPANDVYVVSRSGGELRVPAVREAVIGIDLEGGSMTVRASYLEGWVDAV
jgi:16S rRNA processing protein RimM